VVSELGETELHLGFPDAPVHPIAIAAADVSDEHPVGLVSRLTNRLGDLEERLHNDVREREGILANVAQAEQMIGKAFDQAGRLEHLRARQAEITEALMPDRVDGPTSEEVDRTDRPGSTTTPPGPSGEPSTNETNLHAAFPYPASLDPGVEPGWELDGELAKELSMSDFER
jgi:hypothetical protein